MVTRTGGCLTQWSWNPLDIDWSNILTDWLELLMDWSDFFELLTMCVCQEFDCIVGVFHYSVIALTGSVVAWFGYGRFALMRRGSFATVSWLRSIRHCSERMLCWRRPAAETTMLRRRSRWPTSDLEPKSRLSSLYSWWFYSVCFRPGNSCWKKSVAMKPEL